MFIVTLVTAKIVLILTENLDIMLSLIVVWFGVNATNKDEEEEKGREGEKTNQRTEKRNGKIDRE